MPREIELVLTKREIVPMAPETGVVLRFLGKLVSGAIAAWLCMGSFAFADRNSNGNDVTVTVASTIREICLIETTTTSVILPDLQRFHGTNAPLATITEVCNNAAGYTVSLASLNAVGAGSNQLFLKGIANANDVIDYSLAYNSVPVTVLAGVATITTSNSQTASASGVSKTLAITTPVGFYPSDTYADTLTLTLTAN